MARELAITGVGLRCSVGQDAPRSLAAVRAGLSRLREWPETAGEDDVTVAAAAVYPDLGDAPWTEKFEALAAQPLLEALRSAGFADAAERSSSRRWQLLLGLPVTGRDGVPAAAEQAWRRDLEQGGALPFAVPAVREVRRGHASALVALRQAIALFEEQDLDFVVVGGVDSLLHSDALSALETAGRLKTSERPVGLLPGEAGAFVVIEPAESALARGAKILALLGGASAEQESDPSDDRGPHRGRALALALRKALARAGCAGGEIGSVLVDLNGERWRFMEQAVASNPALASLPPDRALWHPADSLGDVGAATGAAHLVLAALALQQGKARGRAVMIVNSSDTGERAAVCVRAAAS